MAVHTITKGLDVPIAGKPRQTLEPAAAPAHVALLAADYHGMRPTMQVEEGDAVTRGGLLFEDKKTPGVRYTSPAAGTVVAVHRGERRALQSVVIALNERERAGAPGDEDFESFESYRGDDPGALKREDIVRLLVESGLWTAFRTRPFSKAPAPDSEPHSIFVTAIDTHPLAPSVETALQGREKDFEKGLLCVAKLTAGPTFLCKAAGANVPGHAGAGLTVEEFQGAHPAGTPGLHIHLLDPVHRGKTVWHIGYQDVAAIGRLFTTGRLDVERVISLAGPSVKDPRLLRTRLGASTDDLCRGELGEGDHRVISGSVLAGRSAAGEVHGFLGRYHQQVSVLPEGGHREFLGWMMPGFDKFSTINLFASRLLKGREYRLTTALHGSKRAMVPIGMYERVMPMDIVPTFLLRALIVGDVEQAEQLGCLELDEEDLALCTFVCPGKYEYGPILRQNLETIEKEG